MKPFESSQSAIEIRSRAVTSAPCPSGSRLLSSLARVYGAHAAGVVMTGMGDDGAAGLLELKMAGGVTLAQDEGSSIVFAMPHAAHACGAADLLLPPVSLASLLLDVLASPG